VPGSDGVVGDEEHLHERELETVLGGCEWSAPAVEREVSTASIRSMRI
jgi:hypothetical protein